jgi:hypothetical protein
MLFDLKGKRKRLVQVVYVALAVLFGVGLVGFGIGGGSSGGIFDAIGGGGGGGSSSNGYKTEVNRLTQKLRTAPKDKKAWSDLAQANYNLARSGGDYDPNTGQFKEGATNTLAAATDAWERYLNLKPRKPNISTALLMFQSYAALVLLANGDPLDRYKKAEGAAEIIAKQQPNPNAFYRVAAVAYAIGQIKKGDAAAKQTLHGIPKDQQNEVKSQLVDLRKRGLKAKQQLKASKKQAAQAAKDAQKTGKDPFGTAPGQTSIGQ